MKAPAPANERERLRVLSEYHILDTGQERSFDDIVRLASDLCDTPAAIITFVDDCRQWFKAAHGLTLTDTHRDLSFCAHPVASGEVLEIPDATKDPRFADNPLVTGAPHIRSYAGVPLISPDGLAVGTVAVLDFKPRTLSAKQLDGLGILSRQIIAQLELRRRAAQSQARVVAAEDDIETAAERHRRMFDSALDAIVTIDSSGRVVEFNAAAEQLFGYERSAAIGCVMAELIIPPRHREEHSRGLARYLATGHSTMLGHRSEVTAMRRDGSEFPAELTIQRLADRGPVAFAGFIRDITAQKQLTNALQASAERYQRQRQALTGLIQDERVYQGTLSEALRPMTKTVATSLGVARVSMWQYVADYSVLRCLDLYELDTDHHSRAAERSASTVPAYFDALRRREVIGAVDARHDPRTRELAAQYLAPLGITSMLDTPIDVQGALYGVLSLEHTGPPRQWTPEDQTFAVAVANLVPLAIESDQRRQAQDALIAKTEILTAVTESLAAYVERSDWKAAFARLLRCALNLTDSEYGFVGVVVDGTLRVLAHEGIVWDKTVNRDFYESAQREYAERGYLTFTNLNNLFGHAITAGEVVVANAPDRDTRSIGRPAGHPPMRSFLGVPIRGHDQITGLIALANRPDGYGGEETARIEALVQQAGGLCENYRQRERSRVQEEERQRVEEALHASEERLRILSRATNDAVWDWNLETDAVVMPDGFEKLFGSTDDPSQPTLEDWRSRIHPDDRDAVEHSIRAALDGDSPRWSAEYRFRRADGSYAAIFDRGYVLRDASGRPTRMIGAMMDISERKQLEAQFRQSQKLEAVGQLAGGVAHDFNNILTVIDGHASLLLANAPEDSEAHMCLRQISEAAARAAGLTRQLLAFSRKQVLQTSDVDMNAIVANMTRLLQRILGEHIALSVELPDQPAFVRADPSMMEQVILNLAINARDAMPSGGPLRLRTTLEQIDARAAMQHPDARPGAFVRVSITDEGCGIRPEILPHIFEPFFTTKGADRGTGLGLATVHGVVKQHQGWITVHSVVDRGTTFDVYLPAVPTPAPAAVDVPREESKPGGGETVLVVEDEDAVRSLARLILERRGYRVLEAQSGKAALALWQEQHGRIDLVVTDMVMPEGVSGMELAARMLADEPALAVIVTSGYSVDLVSTDFARLERVSFLAKPYTPDQLTRAVRASLDEGRPTT
ncbi:MAG TPA: GAF domain-containing protein [Vicinamibacterales bacterium]|nr:GAF domain-containing protein [Vicinamibacterales bacterium]